MSNRNKNTKKRVVKIMFISGFFAPYNTIGAVRTTRTAEYLAHKKYDVTVFTISDLSFEKNLDFRCKTIKVKSAPYKLFGNNSEIAHSLNKPKGSVSRQRLRDCYKRILYRLLPFPDKFVLWNFKILPKVNRWIKNSGKPDIIIASGSPFSSFFLAYYLSKKFSIPWIAEYRDLWTNNHYIKKNRFNNIMESVLLSTASRIVTVSQPLADCLEVKYKRKVDVIMNGFDEVDIPQKTECRAKGRKKIVYTGSFHEGFQDASILISALSKNVLLQREYELIFYGENFSTIQRMVAEKQLENCVRFPGKISHAQVAAVLKNSDLLLFLPWKRDSGIVTGKIFEYIGSTSPILYLGESDSIVSKMITENELGFVCKDTTELVILLARDEFKKIPKENGKSFKRCIQLELFEDILKQELC